jgi:hypothetical protein
LRVQARSRRAARSLLRRLRRLTSFSAASRRFRRAGSEPRVYLVVV